MNESSLAGKRKDSSGHRDNQFMTNSENRRVFISYFAMEKPTARSQRPSSSVKSIAHNLFYQASPASVLQATNTGLRRPGYETTSQWPVTLSDYCTFSSCPQWAGINFISDLQTLVIISSLNLAKSTR